MSQDVQVQPPVSLTGGIQTQLPASVATVTTAEPSTIQGILAQAAASLNLLNLNGVTQSQLDAAIASLHTTVSGEIAVVPTHYTHNQIVAASQWSINHNLGYKPGGFQAFDSSGNTIEGDIVSSTATTLILDFNGRAISGHVDLS